MNCITTYLTSLASLFLMFCKVYYLLLILNAVEEQIPHKKKKRKENMTPLRALSSLTKG